MKLTGSLPKVSVVVASYNTARYLPQAVESVLAQTYPNIEVVVIDDGSEDDTVAVMESYVSDERVVFHSQPNRGQPKAKNQGIRLASGEFVAFCDADDYWAPSKLERQIPHFLKDSTLAVVASEVSIIDQEGREVEREHEPRHNGFVLDKLLLCNFIPFGTAVIRKSALDDVGWFDESMRMGIDWDLWLRMAVKYRFYVVDEPLYFYRVWSGQMSSNYRGRYAAAFNILDKFFRENPSVVSEKLKKKAYADTYVSQGRALYLSAGARREALRSYWRALRLCAAYPRAWKQLIKLLVGIRR